MVAPIGNIKKTYAMHRANTNIMHKRNSGIDMKAFFDSLKTGYKISRHSSLPKCLNFYPRVYPAKSGTLFAVSVLTISHCCTFASSHELTHKPKLAKELQFPTRKTFSIK